MSNELPLPKSLSIDDYSDKAEVNGTLYTAEQLNQLILPYINSSNLVEKEVAFENLVGLIKYINKNSIKINGLDQPIQELIDSHFSTNISGKQRTDALKNMVYFNIWKSGKSLKNWISQTTSIDVEPARVIARSSMSGKYSTQISNNNPMARFVLQYQNSIGKKTIGINAVGIKVWSLLLNYFHEGLKRCATESEFFHKYTSYKRDYSSGKPERAALRAYLDSGQELHLQQSETIPNIDWIKVNSSQFLKELRDNSIKYNNIPQDVFVTISILLSSSTDNAKELILEKINAGPSSAGIYIYLLSTGVDFDTCAKFMTTSPISLAQSKSKRNIFLTQDSFANGINYYLNGVNINNYLPKDYVTSFKDAITHYFLVKGINFKSLDKYLETFTTYEETKKALEPIRQYLIELDLQPKKSDNSGYTEDSYDYLDSEVGEEFFDEGDYFYVEEDQDNTQRSSGPKVGTYINRYFRDVYNRKSQLEKVKDLEKFNENLKTLKILSESSNEITILGRLGSLNQGIKTKLEDKVNFELHIENFVNKRFNSVPANINQEIQLLAEKYNLPSTSIFNFELFASDLEYRKNISDLYEYVKDTFNILGIISNVPHFKAMLDAYGVDNSVESGFVDVYRIGKKLAKIYTKDKLIARLLPKHKSIINNFLNEVIITKYLSTLKNSGVYTKFGDTIFYNKTLTTESSPRELNFSNPDDLGTFKYLFENSYLADFKKQYPNNSFIQDLTWNSFTDNYGTSYEMLQLPLNLDTVDQESNKETFNKYLQDFNKIREDMYNGKPIKDWFYLYNLIVNGNRPGKSSLSKIFKDSLKSGNIENSIIYDYFNFQSNMTKNPQSLSEKDFDNRDLIFRLLEPGQTYRNLTKNRENGKTIFSEGGISMLISTLGNAVKLPFSSKMFSSVDDLLTLDIRTKMLDLAKLNQLEIKLICDE